MDQLSLPFSDREIRQKKLCYGDSYEKLEQELLSDINSARRKEPLAGILIVVPSGILGRYLKDRIRGGGVSVLNFKQLALGLAMDTLLENNMTEVPRSGEEIIARQALMNSISEDSVFYPYRESPGMIRVFMSLLKEFRQGGFEKFDDIKDLTGRMCEDGGEKMDGEKLETLFNLVQAYRSGFKGRYFDVEDAISAAVDQCECFYDIYNTDCLFIYGFLQFDHVQKQLINRISHYVNTNAYIPYFEKNEISEQMLEFFKSSGFTTGFVKDGNAPGSALEQVRNRVLAGNFENLQKLKDDSVIILSCSSIPDEVAEIARNIIFLAREGMGFDDMAVVVKDMDGYGPQILNSLESLGIPCCYHDGYKASLTPVGRSFTLLLNLIGSDFSRIDVMEFITSSVINFNNFFENYTPPVSRWELITREIGIKSGIETWKRKLKNHTHELRKREGEQADESIRDALKEKTTDTENLNEFITVMFQDLISCRGRDNWDSHYRRVIELLEKYFSGAGGYSETLSVLKGLEHLSDISPIVDFSFFVSLVFDRLDSNIIRKGRFNEGYVNILNIRNVPGLSFKAVFIPGMIISQYPGQSSQNPLLLDEEKRIFNRVYEWKGRLMTSEDLHEIIPLLFVSSVKACREKLILSYSRVDPDNNREQIPSSYVLDVASLAWGGEVSYENLSGIPNFTSIPPRFYRQMDPCNSIDESEYNEIYLRKGKYGGDNRYVSDLGAVNKSFQRALYSRQMRLGSEFFSCYDGLIRNNELMESLKKKVDSVYSRTSASKIEQFYTCPYRFFISRILGVSALDNDVDLNEISPRNRGSLYHNIFYDFFMKIMEEYGLPLKNEQMDEYLRIIREIASDAFERSKDAGITGSFASWYEKEINIREDLEVFIEKEFEDMDYIPSHFEYSFGSDRAGKNKGRVFEIELDDGTILGCFGRIDRIDISRDGRKCRIIDYKTGAHKGEKMNDNFDGGRQIQLPLYLKSIEQVMPRVEDIENSQALYYFITRKGGFRKIGYSGKTLVENEENLKKLIGGAVSLPRKGFFVPFPGKKREDGGENCIYCDYKTICPADIGVIFELKRMDPILEPFLELREIT